jgi:diguanylate cyclase (GGDEF)-like protein
MAEVAANHDCVLRAGGFHSLLRARLPALRCAVLHQLEDPSTDSDSLARTLELDPVLAAQLLGHCSEPPIGLDCDNVSLTQFCTRAPRETLKKILRSRPRGPSGFHWQAENSSWGPLWEWSLATAAASRFLARQHGGWNEDEAYLVGLLSSLGRYAMLEKQGARYADWLLDGHLAHPDLVQERLQFGEDHEALGIAWAQAWELPCSVRTALGAEQESSRSMPSPRDLVAQASQLAHAAGFGERSDESRPLSPDNPVAREMMEVCERAGKLLSQSFQRPGDLQPRTHQQPPRPRPGSIAPVSRRLLLDWTRQLDSMQSEAEICRWLKGIVLQHTAFERAFLLLHNDQEDSYSEVLTERERGQRLPLSLGSEQIPEFVAEEVLPSELSDPSHVLLRSLGGPKLQLFSLYSGGRSPTLGLLACDRRYSARPARRRDQQLVELVSRLAGQEIERRRLIDRLAVYRDDAEKDYLTGIYNRRFTMRLLERELLRARRTQSPLALIMLDIDNFKAFNDLYGHLAGDVVLREVSRLLWETARNSDIVGRFGGEEFLIVLPETPIENAYVFAERLRSVVELYGRDKLTQYPDRPPTISIGVSWVLLDKDTPDTAIQRVDRALYASKQAGRNRVCLGLTDEETP